ncbi:hypothetical protein BU24DRAFT_418061 [Aaosphaeria arxii CBS 175.79]|uniref:Reverse transcriptase domain-containing protein n=1 Tax=Aaosphaeria arxii CBS 175.79 TaxID=1450172 RepID=A0A6A5Y031_9PLEO|nr:uncharacterized protein BU24DRAFT_418061 [Aaosphaeria arxii CBS 175.79]KAF2018533.1 hypothetical protein BU24DRAFT_418061 [Aaosphaeria arxii CBS 175.79]
MASSGSVFSSTLQTITTTKLEELDQQRVSYEKKYADLIRSAQAEQDPVKRLFILVDGAKACLGVKTNNTRKSNDGGPLGRVVFGGTRNHRLETDLSNLDRFLEQARYDPSVSPKVLADWEKCIVHYLAVQSSKYQYADLYGKLVTEWLSSEKQETSDGDVEMAESFEEIPGAKKLEARTEWEKVVFEQAKVDTTALSSYLRDLFFSKKDVGKAIEELRKTVENFEQNSIGADPFNVSTLRWVIDGLQSSDLLNNEKREVLKDFLSNDIILTEIADVLNMRMSALDRWTWGDHVPLEQRRKVNGTFSIHMHEDLLQAIFLQYIGVKWSVLFKNAFKKFRAQAWTKAYPTITKEERIRRGYFLGNTGDDQSRISLHSTRDSMHRNRYFAHQLLDQVTQRIEYEEGEEEAEFADHVDMAPKRKRSRQTAVQSMPSQAPHARMVRAPAPAAQKRMAQNMMAQQAFGGSRGGYSPSSPMYSMSPAYVEEEEEETAPASKKPMEVKQGLLHLLSAEIAVNTKLHGELTCFHSVFDSWNPLLPHTTVIAILKYFGVSVKWLTFFKTFLQAPLKFMDDGDVAPRSRRRGTPGSHALSDVFGETILFCLDFSINQDTNGGVLHRLYDDIWFWSPEYETCVKAWACVLSFKQAMGVHLNDTKTGSVRITLRDTSSSPLDIDERLPAGEIRWGFLRLDPATGRFAIDKAMVESHVEELRGQLKGKSKSIIDWIQAWNTYAATFFSSNFGKAANCFGRAHVDMMLATHRHIQERIFDGGNVVQFLKKMIDERFGVKNVPDGFLFFPVELGGLDLKSPFVGLLQIRESVKENPFDLIDEFLETEKEDYVEAKRVFDSGDLHGIRYGTNAAWKPEFAPTTFFSFEEFVKFREEIPATAKANLVATFRDLLRKPTEQSIDFTAPIREAIERLQGQHNLRGITSDWQSMEAYWKWVTQMYGPEMVATFGGLNVVDPGLLPIGMVSMFRQKRTKWQG